MNAKNQILRSETGYAYHGLTVTGLTPRESQALLLRAQGIDYKTCAELMNCSVSAVKARICNLFYKLDVDNTPQLITKAFTSGHIRALSITAVLLMALTQLPAADGKQQMTRAQRTHSRFEHVLAC